MCEIYHINEKWKKYNNANNNNYNPVYELKLLI